MAATFQHEQKAESSVRAAMAAVAALNIIKEELEAAVAAHDEQLTQMNPTRNEYDALFFKHKKVQARYEKVLQIISSRQTTYRQHKRYFSSLSNALLVSNANLRSSPRPITDLQTLTHATLMHEFKQASHTLTNMIFESKRLDTIKNLFWELDQKLRQKSVVIYQKINRDYKKLDQLHAEVLAVEKKLGKERVCGGEVGECPSCARTKERAEREAKEAAEEKAKLAFEKDLRTNKRRDKSTGNGPKAKTRLEDIIEEEESGDSVKS